VSLKVLFVIEGLGHGGAERSLAEMLPGLIQAGISPTVVFFKKHQQSLEHVFRDHGVVLHFLPPQGLIHDILTLRRLIRSEQPDVVHTALFKADLIGRLASIGQGAAVVSSLVNTNYDPIRLQNRDISAPKLWLVRQIDAWTARRLTTHLHAVSEPVKQAAVGALGVSADRITVIERGRNASFVRPNADHRAMVRQNLGLQPADEVIVTLGRQEYQKGQKYLLEAMADVARQRPRAVLLLAGSPGRQSATLRAITKACGLEGCVRILGHRDDVADLLAAADLFVFPSLYEGAAGALLEAMAVGLPIVASRIPAIASSVEEGRNALLVERATVEPLARAIVELLSDPERAGRFGRHSRDIFEERFTLERCAARMVEFYRLVAQRKGGPFTTRPVPAVHCE
jgi:glycosyltransferase involved in cell wall biosynthesis